MLRPNSRDEYRDRAFSEAVDRLLAGESADLGTLADRMWELAAWMGREVPERKPADAAIA